MDVGAAIRARHSIRKFKHKALTRELLEDLMDHMRLAPSARNKQSWEMVVVVDDVLKTRLVPACADQGFLADCSAFIIGVSEPGAKFSVIDMTIAFDHLTLRAIDHGLGTCWIGAFDPEAIKGILGIPSDRGVPICVAVGYPDQEPTTRKRKDPSDLFHMDRW